MNLTLRSPIVDERIMTARFAYSADAMDCGHALVTGERYLLLVQVHPHPHVRVCSSCMIRVQNGAVDW